LFRASTSSGLVAFISRLFVFVCFILFWLPLAAFYVFVFGFSSCSFVFYWFAPLFHFVFRCFSLSWFPFVCHWVSPWFILILIVVHFPRLLLFPVGYLIRLSSSDFYFILLLSFHFPASFCLWLVFCGFAVHGFL
jgi:hypothetical protein